MPSGDSQRVWFPEMIDRLRQQCRETIPFPALIEVCRSLDAMLQRIRSERNILSPVMRCPKLQNKAVLFTVHARIPFFLGFRDVMPAEQAT